MDEIRRRLVRCFSSVFPELPLEQVPAASIESLADWNSLAAVTLFAILQQEFGIHIGLADLPQLTSFEAIENFVGKRMVAASRDFA
jgi:acyl carrier protein